MGQYDVGLACLNGHAINGSVARRSEHNTDYCPECGAGTIHQCPHCKAEIRGEYYVYRSQSSQYWAPPAYCHQCGKPYPWTQRRAEALSETLDELDELIGDDREKLKQSIPDILEETPKSGTAVLRFKKAAAKVGAAGGKVLTDVLAKVAAEAVKRMMGL